MDETQKLNHRLNVNFTTDQKLVILDEASRTGASVSGLIRLHTLEGILRRRDDDVKRDS